MATQDARAASVLIVGSGPTGLTLAIELARRGVPCRIIDSITERSDKSRALVLHPRSMEMIRLLGADAGFKDAQQATAVEIFVLGIKIAGLTLSDYGAEDTRFPFITFVSQEVTEKVLEKRLAELGVRVEYGVKLTGLTQDAEQVIATLKVAGGVEEVRCAYIVGCDGAHSKVRHELELTFAGAAYPEAFLLADAKIDWRMDHHKLRAFLGARGVMVFFPMLGAQMSRLIMVRPDQDNITRDDSAPNSEAELSLGEVETWARRYSKRSLKLTNPVWVTRFRLHHRGVGAYRLGRAFVAGDAAHIHSPVGGQGMNTGIQDAFNLGWKLAWVLKHKLGKAEATALLDTYHTERHPVGQRLLKTTDRLFRVAATGSLILAGLRNLVAPIVIPVVTRIPAIRFRAFRFISQLGIRYRLSPLNLTERQPPRRSFPQPGDRAADGHMDNGSWLYDAFKHGGMTLVGLAMSDVDLAALKGANRWLDCPTVWSCAPELVKRYGVKQRTLILVRPDAHLLLRLDNDKATAENLTTAIKNASWKTML